MKILMDTVVGVLVLIWVSFSNIHIFLVIFSIYNERWQILNFFNRKYYAVNSTVGASLGVYM